jgi:hypothetical protein
MDGTVPGVMRRNTCGAGLGEYLPQVLVNLQDVGLNGNHKTLNRCGTTGDGEASPLAFR